MAFDLAYDYESYFKKDPTLKQSDIDELKRWAQTLSPDSTVPKNITDKQLLIFHLGCLRVMENTKKCIKTYYAMRDKNPDHFDDRDGTIDVMKEVQQVQEFIYMPERTDEGYGILLNRLHDFTVEKYNYPAGCKWNTMAYDAVLNEEGPYNGIILLFDMRGVKFGHITRVPMAYMLKYTDFVQEALNGRIEAIHILNVIPLIDKIMKIIRPFLKGDLVKRIVLHRSDMDWEAFYRDCIPKKCLPSDYGGDLPDSQTLNRQSAERILRNKPMFDAEERQRHSYSRNKKKINTETNLNFLNID